MLLYVILEASVLRVRHVSVITRDGHMLLQRRHTDPIAWNNVNDRIFRTELLLLSLMSRSVAEISAFCQKRPKIQFEQRHPALRERLIMLSHFIRTHRTIRGQLS